MKEEKRRRGEEEKRRRGDDFSINNPLRQNWSFKIINEKLSSPLRLCTKIVEKLEKCGSPHFSSGVKMGVSAPLLRAGFRKNRIFVQSR
jgi:hypothetical protein